MNKYYVTESNGKYFAKVHNMDFVGNQKIVAEIEAKNYYEACRMVEAGQFTTVEDFGGRTEEGYMGATAWIGNKCNRSLWGADLSKAIREDIKKCGIKGVTVSCETYSGGQSIKLTFKVSNDDFVPYAEWRAEAGWKDITSWSWISLPDGRRVAWDEFMKLDEKSQEEAYRYAYDNRVGCDTVNEFYLEENKVLRESLKYKIRSVKRIVDAYNYDDSNSMVDYFDTNFYSHYKLRKAG